MADAGFVQWLNPERLDGAREECRRNVAMARRTFLPGASVQIDPLGNRTWLAATVIRTDSTIYGAVVVVETAPGVIRRITAAKVRKPKPLPVRKAG